MKHLSLYIIFSLLPFYLYSQSFSDFVFIPSGEYTVGNISGNHIAHTDEDPVHNVILTNDFFICKYEVTNSNFFEVMELLPAETFKGKNMPVTGISWYDAIDFCNKLSDLHGFEQCYKKQNGIVIWDTLANGFRLPTNAEWEIACRAGTKTDYYTGKQIYKGGCYPVDPSYDIAGWYCGNSNNKPQPVGKKAPNSFGIFDMHGNAWEWVWDSYDMHYYDQFSSKKAVNPRGPGWSDYKVMRSGSFRDISNYGRSSDRNKVNAATSYNNIGIRLVLGACDETAFDYPDFADAEGLKMVGSAAVNADKAVQLTPSAYWERGAVWLKQPVPVKKGFSTKFSFRMSDGDDGIPDGSAPGADGIAFVLRGVHSNPLGRAGLGIGYEDIINSIAVEFDTYKNAKRKPPSTARDISEDILNININDPNGNHIAVMSRGTDENKPVHDEETEIAASTDIPEIKIDGTVYYAEIDYSLSAARLQVYLDTVKTFSKPAITVNGIKLHETINLFSGTHAFAGFTASTGDSREKHEILSWSACPHPEDQIVSVEREISAVKRKNKKIKIYPNPCRNEAAIEFFNPSSAFVKIEIYNALGIKAQEILSDYLPRGSFRTRLNAENFGSGVYYVRIFSKDTILSSRLIIVN